MTTLKIENIIFYITMVNTITEETIDGIYKYITTTVGGIKTRDETYEINENDDYMLIRIIRWHLNDRALTKCTYYNNGFINYEVTKYGNETYSNIQYHNDSNIIRSKRYNYSNCRFSGTIYYDIFGDVRVENITEINGEHHITRHKTNNAIEWQYMNTLTNECNIIPPPVDAEQWILPDYDYFDNYNNNGA
jgi:hypothetical protein